jgi:hypothetical protein
MQEKEFSEKEFQGLEIFNKQDLHEQEIVNFFFLKELQEHKKFFITGNCRKKHFELKGIAETCNLLIRRIS